MAASLGRLHMSQNNGGARNNSNVKVEMMFIKRNV